MVFAVPISSLTLMPSRAPSISAAFVDDGARAPTTTMSSFSSGVDIAIAEDERLRRRRRRRWDARDVNDDDDDDDDDEARR